MNYLKILLAKKFPKNTNFEELHSLLDIPLERWQHLLNDNSSYQYSFTDLMKIAEILQLTCCPTCFFTKLIEVANKKGKNLTLTK